MADYTTDKINNQYVEKTLDNMSIRKGLKEAIDRKNANRSLIDSAFPGQGTPMDAKDHPVDSIQHPGVGNTPHTGISDDTIPFKE